MDTQALPIQWTREYRVAAARAASGRRTVCVGEAPTPYRTFPRWRPPFPPIIFQISRATIRRAAHDPERSMSSNMLKGLAAGVAIGAVAVGAAVVTRTSKANAMRVEMQEAAETPATQVALAPTSHDTIEVWKSATCGCCHMWIEYLQQQGFVVVAHDMSDPELSAIKTKNGVTDALASCHTAHVGGYVLEGHVPAEDIRKLLAERPKIRGLAVPGMIAGTPGMGDTPAKFSVVAFDTKGATTVYSQH
jgi:hypothetical protein